MTIFTSGNWTVKNFGSKSEYHTERTRDLLRAYFRYLETCTRVSMPDVFKQVVEMPAARFWVSAPRATVVVANILRGDKLRYMRPNKRAMFLEIHRRVMNMKASRPDWPVARLVNAVIAQPAPKFYLAPGSARVLILKARKKWFEETAARMRRFATNKE